MSQTPTSNATSQKQSQTLRWFRNHLRVPVTGLILATFALWNTQVKGATLYWDVNGTTAGFSTVVGGWNGTNNFFNTDSTGGAGTVSAVTSLADDIIIKQATTNTGSITVTGAQNANSITFAANVGPTTTITGGTSITLGGNAGSGIFQQSSGANVVSSPLILASTGTAFSYSNSAGGLLTIGATTGSATTGTQTITVGSSSTGGITLNGIIGDGAAGGKVALAVNNTGTGVTTMSGVNTYSGGTTLKAGIITATTSASALGTGTFTLGDTTGSAAATLRTSTTGLTFANPIVLATGTTGTLSLGVTGTAISTTFSGGVTGTNNLNFLGAATTGTITMSGLINNTGTVTNSSTGTGAVIISNAAGLGTNVTSLIQNSATSATNLTGVLTANSTYTGTVQIKAGTLNANAGAAFGILGTGALTIGDTAGTAAATLNFGSAFTTTEANNITVAAGSTGTMTISNTTANSRTLTGTLAVNNAGGLTISSTNTGSLTFNGVITSANPITINNTNTGVTVFGANNSTTLSGAININAGTLRAGNATTPLGTSAITLGAASGTAAATLQSSVSSTIPNNITVQAGSTGVKTINSSGNTTMTWSGLITANDSLTISNGGTGAWTVNNAGNTLAAGKTLTVNDTNTAAVNLGAWSTGAGSAITFNVTNTGSLNLNGIISGGASVTTIGGNNTGVIAFTQQNTYTGGTTFSTATGSAAAPTVDSTPTSGTITSGPFGTGTLTFSGGSMRAGTGGDRTIGNAITAAGNMTFITLASEKSLIFTGPMTLTGNRTFTTNTGATVAGKTVNFSGAIGDGGGAFGITQAGTGNLTLSGANTYTGNTAATSGLLVVTGSVANGSGLSIAPAVAAGGAVSFVNNAANTPTNFGAVSLGSATGPAIIGLDLGTASDIIAASGAATVTNNVAFAINGAAGFGAGNYNLITATGGLTASAPTYSISRAPGGFTYGFTNTDTQVQLNVSAVAASTLYWRGQINNSLSAFSGGVTNWATDAAGTAPANYTPGVNQTAVFSATGATGPTITTTMDGDMTLGDLQFIAAPSGVTAVTLNPGNTPGGAASTLTLTPSVTTAGISVASAAGAVTIAAPIVLGASQTWSVDGTAPSSLTVSGAITGAGTNGLTITGGAGLLGVVSLTAAAGQNTYSGPTVIGNGGILQGTVAANLSQNSAMTVNGTGILRLNGIANTVPSLSGNGFVENNSAATAVALTINNAGTSDFSGTLRNGGAANLNIVKSGTGTQTFSGTYNYTGTTTVNAGILRFSGTDTAAAANTITVNIGGTVQFGASNPLNAVTNLNLAGAGVATLDLNGFSGTIGGHTSTATTVITNNSTSTAASSATTVGTPSGTGVYVDALTIATGAQTVTGIVQDGPTRKTQIIVNNANTGTGAITVNTANTYSGGLVLANSVAGTRMNVNAAITGTPWGTGPIIIGQTNTDKASIYFSTVGNTVNNPIIFNTSLGSDRFGIRTDGVAVTLAGQITANSDAVFSGNNAAATTVNLTNKVTGSGGLVVDVSQTSTASTLLNVVLNTSANNNDYAGDTIVGRVNGTPAQNWAATLSLGAADQIPNGTGKGNVTVTNNSGTRTGTLNLAGFSDTINGLNGNGTVDGTSGTPTLTLGDGNASGTFSGVLKNTAGTLTLTKIGTGTQTLSGTNTFAGPVNINGGAVAITASANLGNAAATNVVNLDGGALSYTGSTSLDIGSTRVVTLGAGGGTLNASNAAGVLTVSGGINPASTGNLIKTGPGTVAFASGTSQSWNSGASSVTVSDGKLVAGFGTGGIGALTVGSTGNMSFVNNLIEALSLGSSGTVLTLNSGARLGFELNGSTNDSITLPGTSIASLTGSFIFDFTQFGAAIPNTATTYTLLTGPAGTGFNNYTYQLGNAPNGFNFSFITTDTTVQVQTNPYTPIYWNNTQGDGSWANVTGNLGSIGAGAGTNFTSDLAGATDAGHAPLAAETVIFNTTTVAGPSITTTLDGNRTVDSLQFIGGGTPSVSSVTIAQGTGGTLTLNPLSSSGGIKILAGAGNATITAPLTLANTTASSQTWEVVDATSVLNVSGATTFTAGINKTGLGTLTLSGNNSGAGGITLTSGTLNINSATAPGTGTVAIGAGTTINNSTAGAIALTTNNPVRFNGDFTFTGTQSLDFGTGAVTMTQNSTITTTANTLTFGGAVGETGGARSLTKAGAGTLVLNGNNNYTGATTVSAGTLTLGGSNVFTGPVALNAGALNLNGNNTGAGGVTVTTGTLNLGDAGALGTGTFAINGGTINNTSGGALTLSTNNAQSWNGSFTFTGTNSLNLGTGAVTLNTTPTVTVTANTLTVAGNISGVGQGITKGGAGTLTLSGTNSYTGLTTNSVSGSILNMSGTFNNAGGITTGSSGITNLSGTSSGNGTVTVNNGTMNISGTLTSAGSITLGGANNLARLNVTSGGVINGATTITSPNFTLGTNNTATRGRLTVVAGASVSGNTFQFGTGATSAGALIQTGGTVTQTVTNATNNFSLGNAASAMGYASISGGSLSSSQFNVGNTGNGVMEISGGTVAINRNTGTSGFLILNLGTTANSSGILNISGGSLDVTQVAAGRFSANDSTGTGQLAVINLSGGTLNAQGTTYNMTRAAASGTTTSNGTSILNLNGGTMTVNTLSNQNLTNAGTTLNMVNFNGGTLRAGANAQTLIPALANGVGYLATSGTYINSGGATIDTNGFATTTIAGALLAPTGSGASSVAVTSQGTGYVGAPVIKLTGGTGVGATAIANMVDDGSGNGTFKIGSITVTNPGTGYGAGDTLTATAVDNTGLYTTQAVLGAVTLAANTSGGLTKTNTGTLILSGANTYTGNTTINAGTLQLGSAGATGVLNPTGSITGAGTFTISRTGTITQGTDFGTITNTGGFNNISTGTTILTATNTYSGGTNNTSTGVLQVGNGGTTGTLGTGAVANAGTLTFNRSNTYTMDASQLVTGAGGTVLTGGVTLVTAAASQFATTGALTIGAANTTTTTQALDLTAGSSSFGSLNVQTNVASANTITVTSGNSLTINGNVTVGSSAGSNTETRLTVTGGGAFNVTNSAASGAFTVGGTTGTANVGNIGILDLSGLATANINLSGATSTIVINPTNTGGTNASTTTARSVLSLAPTSSLTAATITIGGGSNYSSGTTNATNDLILGSTSTTIKANTINVGSGSRDVGTIAGGGAGTVAITAQDGVGRATLNIGVANNNTATSGSDNLVDFNGHNSTLLLSTLTVGNQNRTGNITNTFNFDTGTLNATAINIGFGTLNNANGSNTITSTINLGGGSVTVGAGGVTMGNVTDTSTGAKSFAGNLNISGGTVNIGTTGVYSIQLGNNTAASGLATVTDTVNLTGGTTTLAGDIIKATNTRTTAVVNLAGATATLDMSGKNIGTATNTVTFNAQAGTLKNLNELNGGGTLTKTTAGTLILEGTNNYTGSTVISAGTLQVGTGSTTGTLGSGLVTNDGVLTFMRSNTVIQTAAISGSGSLNQNGTGILTLSGTNSYAGPTNVNAGTLNVMNTTGSATGNGSVTISTSGTLAGAGKITAGAGNVVTINGALVVGDATAVSPTGGILDITTSGGGSTIFGASSILRFDLFSGAGLGNNTSTAGTSSDLLRLFGDVNVTAGSTLLLSNPNSMNAWAVGDTWKIFDWTGLGTLTGGTWSVDFTGLSLPGTLGVDTTNLYTAGTISIITVPEPSRALLLLFGLLGLGFRRRRQ